MQLGENCISDTEKNKIFEYLIKTPHSEYGPLELSLKSLSINQLKILAFCLGEGVKFVPQQCVRSFTKNQIKSGNTIDPNKIPKVTDNPFIMITIGDNKIDTEVSSAWNYDNQTFSTKILFTFKIIEGTHEIELFAKLL